MKEKYFSPMILNVNALELSINEKPILESIATAVMKKMFGNPYPSIISHIASATSRRVYGATDFGEKNFSLTKRKF